MALSLTQGRSLNGLKNIGPLEPESGRTYGHSSALSGEDPLDYPAPVPSLAGAGVLYEVRTWY